MYFQGILWTDSIKPKNPEQVKESDYFKALVKEGILIKNNSSYYPPNNIQEYMINNDLEYDGIYRRKTAINKDKLNHTFGFNCSESTLLIEKVLIPVVNILDTVGRELEELDEQVETLKELIRGQKGIRLNLVDAKSEREKIIRKHLGA